jgi:hypothetical protein
MQIYLHLVLLVYYPQRDVHPPNGSPKPGDDRIYRIVVKWRRSKLDKLVDIDKN